MKIRTDFVSNSSSSSFIVHQETGDVKLICQKMAELFNDAYIPDELNDHIEVFISTKNKWYKDIFKILKPDEECKFEDTYTDFYSKKTILKDPEEISWDSLKIDFDTLIHLADFNIIDKIDHLYFSAYDENSEICNYYLAKIFRFFEAIDGHPDKSESEREFLSEDNNDFFNVITKITNQKMKGNNI